MAQTHGKNTIHPLVETKKEICSARYNNKPYRQTCFLPPPHTRQIPWLALIQIHHGYHISRHCTANHFALQIVHHQLLVCGMEPKTRWYSSSPHGALFMNSLPKTTTKNKNNKTTNKTGLFQQLPALLISLCKEKTTNPI